MLPLVWAISKGGVEAQTYVGSSRWIFASLFIEVVEKRGQAALRDHVAL